jgi:hypothetical protein
MNDVIFQRVNKMFVSFDAIDISNLRINSDKDSYRGCSIRDSSCVGIHDIA